MIAIGISKDGRVCDWSRGAEVVSGFARDEVMGLHFVDELLDIEGQNLVDEMVAHARKGQPVPDIQLPFYTKCGRRKDLCLTPTLIRSGAKDDHQITLSGGLYTGNASKSIGVDREGCITHWGDEVGASTEFTPEEVMGMSLVDDIVTYDLRDLVVQKLDRVLAGDAVPEFGLFIYSKSGVQKFFSIRVHQGSIDGGVEGVNFVLTEQDGSQEVCKKGNSQPRTTDSLSTCAPTGDQAWTQDSLPSYWAPSMDLENMYQEELMACMSASSKVYPTPG
eukprot:CAMPEP_0179103584 /NCGR_PEP_ID=MMETSP0796-20121207/48006_1 /TAXON_ID=73915 /ORGANISM="Pyrodinium bahamense, Strain pbaha01" /LENGTH=276 /DNA_ID=CAMNT_0020801501 /DNA_START=11 /DNA_END=839 /DNA_ORIENTATION=-